MRRRQNQKKGGKDHDQVARAKGRDRHPEIFYIIRVNPAEAGKKGN